jgi:type I restriction enzyme, R subunit
VGLNPFADDPGMITGDIKNQIEFVNLIVNHLTEHGVMDAGLLYESPFTDLTPRGPDGIFSSGEVDELIAILDRIRATALVA